MLDKNLLRAQLLIEAADLLNEGYNKPNTNDKIRAYTTKKLFENENKDKIKRYLKEINNAKKRGDFETAKRLENYITMAKNEIKNIEKDGIDNRQKMMSRFRADKNIHIPSAINKSGKGRKIIRGERDIISDGSMKDAHDNYKDGIAYIKDKMKQDISNKK